jgi:alpha-1,3-rhamnosyl/mannosyltransferase
MKRGHSAFQAMRQKASNHGRLSAFLRRQPLLIEAYRLLHPRRQAWA